MPESLGKGIRVIKKALIATLLIVACNDIQAPQSVQPDPEVVPRLALEVALETIVEEPEELAGVFLETAAPGDSLTIGEVVVPYLTKEQESASMRSAGVAEAAVDDRLVTMKVYQRDVFRSQKFGVDIIGVEESEVVLERMGMDWVVKSVEPGPYWHHYRKIPGVSMRLPGASGN